MEQRTTAPEAQGNPYLGIRPSGAEHHDGLIGDSLSRYIAASTAIARTIWATEPMAKATVRTTGTPNVATG